MSVSRDFIDPCSPRRPRHRHCVGQAADSPPWAEWPKPPRSVPEQCLVFGFHISSLVQGVDILVQDILIQDGCGFLTVAARHPRRRWRRDQRAPTPAIPEKPIWPASAVEPRSRFGNSNPNRTRIMKVASVSWNSTRASEHAARVCERRKRDTSKGHETGAVAPIAEHFLNFVFTRVVNH
jgi:hypothetical protein